MVEWHMARRIARLAAGSEPAGETPALTSMAAAAEADVARYTGLRAAAALPPPEAIDRGAWAEINVNMMAGMLAPVVERLGAPLEGTGPLAAPLRGASRAILAAEVGLVTGYLAQRVLGQYELSLLQPEITPRLLFVVPNIEQTVARLEVDRKSFLHWIVLHEMTHALQFGGVAWLRSYLGGLLREYLASVELRVRSDGPSLLPALPDPAALVERFREGGLVGLVQTREQRAIVDRIQSAMAVIEGYSEHVMDAVGAEVVPAYAGLREAMERRRRNRPAPERLLQKLLGFDLKLRQYEQGKRFCDGVVELGGIAALNRVWTGPEALPTAAELDAPAQWLARVPAHRALPAPA